MSNGHTLGRIRNQITGYKGILHSHMAHGNAVTNRNGREYHRHTACFCNTKFYGIYYLINIHMARNDLIIGRYDSYHWFFHFICGKSQSVKQASCRSLLHTATCVITDHNFPPPSIYFSILFKLYKYLQIKSPISAVPTCFTSLFLLSS